MEAQRRTSQPYAAQADPNSGQYAIAPKEWTRFDETEPPVPVPPQTLSHPVPVRSSRLPWLIALIAVAAATGTGVMLYMKLQADKTKPATVASKEPEPQHEVTMTQTPAVTQPAAGSAAAPVDKPADKPAEKPAEKPTSKN